jgi:hypothetical protein
MIKEFTSEPLEPLIYNVRGHRVLLDADLARLYGAATKVLNQAVKRNPDRFPADFAFQLESNEFTVLRSQIATSRAHRIERKEEKLNRSQFVTGSQKHRDPLSRPWVYTEHGALMAATLLRSDQAVRMSLFVVRAFVRLREHIAADAAILKRLAEIDKSLLQHDAALRDLYKKLLPLLQPPADAPKRRIGFHSD